MVTVNIGSGIFTWASLFAQILDQ